MKRHRDETGQILTKKRSTAIVAFSLINSRSIPSSSKAIDASLTNSSMLISSTRFRISSSMLYHEDESENNIETHPSNISNKRSAGYISYLTLDSTAVRP